MADVLETRCVSEAFRGSEQVLRIAGIGDSLMYGAGVTPREALPAQLCRVLNAAFVDDLVWVDNFGENSGNIWHAWAQFRMRAQSMRFDAFVFSICNNDIALFESNTIGYDDHDHATLWTTNQNFGQSTVDLFENIKELSDGSPIVPLIVFYTLSPEDQPIIDRIAAICASLELPFMDLHAYLITRTAVTQANFYATEFDGHPSGLVHDAVARGIAERLRQEQGLSRGRFGAEPERVFAAALDDLVTQGVDADAALSWAAEALTAKQRATQRALSASSAADAARLAAAADAVRATGDRWRVLRRLEARVPAADQVRSLLVPNLVQLYHLARNLDELVFILMKTRDPVRLGAFGRLFARGYFVTEQRLDFFHGDVPAEIAAIRDALPGLPAVSLLQRLAEECEDEPGPLRSAHAGLTLASFDRELGRLGQFAARLRAQLEGLSEAWSAASLERGQQDIARLWAIACVMIRDARDYLASCETVFGQGPALDAPIPGRWTSIDVIVEGKADPAVAETTLYRMTVEAWFAVPQRMPVREVHWGGADRNRVAHHFEIPALLRGDIRVGLAAGDPTLERFLRGTSRIAEIRIRSGIPGDAPTPAIEWRNTGQNLPSVNFTDVTLP